VYKRTIPSKQKARHVVSHQHCVRVFQPSDFPLDEPHAPWYVDVINALVSCPSQLAAIAMCPCVFRCFLYTDPGRVRTAYETLPQAWSALSVLRHEPHYSGMLQGVLASVFAHRQMCRSNRAQKSWEPVGGVVW